MVVTSRNTVAVSCMLLCTARFEDDPANPGRKKLVEVPNSTQVRHLRGQPPRGGRTNAVPMHWLKPCLHAEAGRASWVQG